MLRHFKELSLDTSKELRMLIAVPEVTLVCWLGYFVTLRQLLRTLGDVVQV